MIFLIQTLKNKKLNAETRSSGYLQGLKGGNWRAVRTLRLLALFLLCLAAVDAGAHPVQAAPNNSDPTISSIDNQVIEEDTVLDVSFTVGDTETLAEDLVVDVFSTDTTLLPLENIEVSGDGAERQLTATPVADMTGTTNITLVVRDTDGDTADTTFSLEVTEVNDAPTIADIEDQQVEAGKLLGPLNFTIGDVDHAFGELTLAAQAEDAALLPPESFSFGGSATEPDRTLEIEPPIEVEGSTTVTVTVSDGLDAGSTSFTVVVLAANQPPEISPLEDQVTDEDVPLTVTFVVTDVETPDEEMDSLGYSALSTNTELVAQQGLLLGGTGVTRTLTITPMAETSGVTDITFAVDDGEYTVDTTFTLTVTAVNDTPLIAEITSRTVDEDTVVEVPFSITDPDTAAEDLTVSAGSSNQSLFPNSNISFESTEYDFVLTLVPEQNQSGTATILVTVGDGENTDGESFVANVTAVNDVPEGEVTFDAEDAVTPEDVPFGPHTISVQDVESAPEALGVTAASSNDALVSNDNISISGTGALRSVTVTPTQDATGITQITFYVDDGEDIGSFSFPLTVEPVNDAPTLAAIEDQATDEDTAAVVLLDISDLETSNADLTFWTEVSNADLLPPGSRNFSTTDPDVRLTLEPAPDLSGSSLVTVTVSDGMLSTSEAFTLSVTPVNDPPVLSALADVSLAQNGELTVDFVLEDVDDEFGVLTLEVSSTNTSLLPVENLTLDGTDGQRTLHLAPLADQYGTTSITVRAGDGKAETSRTFEATVLAYPTISAVVDQTTDEDGTHTVNFTVNDPDTDRSELALSAVSSNTNLVPAQNLSFVGGNENPALQITPAQDLHGSSRITITVDDGTLSDQTAFWLQVNSVDDPPVIDVVPDQLIDQDGVLSIAVTVQDTDTAVAEVLLDANSNSNELLPDDQIVIEGSGEQRSLTATPANGTSGQATITLTAGDGTTSIEASFLLTVNGPPSITIADTLTMAEDTARTVNFTVGDPDNELDSLSVTAVSANTDLIDATGLVTGGEGANRTLTLTPQPDQNGSTTVDITVDDGRLQQTRTMSVTVDAVNDAPTISPIDPQTVDEDSTQNPIPFTVADVDNNVGSLALFGNSSNLDLLPHTNVGFEGSDTDRSILVTPRPDTNGATLITVTVSDGALSASSDFTLTVAPLNDPPSIAPVPPQETYEDQAITVTVTVSDTDSDLSSLSLSAETGNPQLVSMDGLFFSSEDTNATTGAQRTLIITPEKDQTGTGAITVVVSDGNMTGKTSFELSVLNVNDPPTIDAIPAQTVDEDTLLEVPLVLHDIDNPPNQLSVGVTSSDPRLFPDRNLSIQGDGYARTLMLQPAPNRTGAANITVNVSDGADQSSRTCSSPCAGSASESGEPTTRTFRVDVRAVNDAPQAVDDTYTIITLPRISFGVLANDVDVDRDSLAVVAAAQGRAGTVSINSDNTLLYRIPPNFIGRDTFTYTVADPQGLQDVGTVTVNVVEPPGSNTLEIHQVTPETGLNDRTVPITISGANFEEGVTANIGPYPLQDVKMLDQGAIEASVPAFLTPGVYDVIVKNPDGDTAVHSSAYRVHTDRIALLTLRPDRGRIDAPTQMNVYGLNFEPGAQVLLAEQPLTTTYVNSSHLHVVVPAGFVDPGRHPVTVVNPDSAKYTSADAYTAFDQMSDDLFGLPYELWSRPGTLHTGQSVQIGLRLRRQVGEAALEDAAVDFYAGTPYDEDAFIGRGHVPLLLARDDANTDGVTWTPPSPGSYTLYAVIDPDNEIGESDETNNVIRSHVTVLPTRVDMDAPVIGELTLDDGAATTTDRDITVRVSAEDAHSAVRSVYLVEYEYIRGAEQWAPVQWSGWLDYGETPTGYEWRFLSSPGIKYIMVWAADEHGNVTTDPVLAGINFVPGTTDSLDEGEMRIYRYSMGQGDQLSAFLVPEQGDPDLYIWPPDYQSRGNWITNLREGVDELGLVAPVAGQYQVEVSAYTPASYRAVLELRRVEPKTGRLNGSNLDPSKAVHTAPVIAVDDMPAREYRLPSAPSANDVEEPVTDPEPEPEPETPYRTYLPGVMNGEERRTDRADTSETLPVYLPVIGN